MFEIVLRYWRVDRLKSFKEHAVLQDSGREFHTEGPQNARLVLYKSMRGRGTMYFVEPYLFEALLKNV